MREEVKTSPTRTRGGGIDKLQGMDDGKPVTTPLTHQAPVLAVAWSPDGRRVATASADHTALVWDVSWDTGTLTDWLAALERCDYRLNDKGVLVERDPKLGVGSGAGSTSR
jgi:WD40 repeat protein